MNLRVLTAAVALLAASPAAASAHHLTPVDPDVVEQSTMVARAAWPDSACTGRERLLIDDEAQDFLDRRGSQGSATPDGCTVAMHDDTTSPVAWCTVLVHEFGHLAGVGHHPDRASVMHSPPATWPACRPLARLTPNVTFHPLAAARDDAARRPSHDWTCRRAHRDLARCVGRPGPEASTVGEIRWARTGDSWTGRVTYRRGPA